MGFCQSVSCNNLTDGNPEPYGDISGPGVMIGFVGSGYLTCIILTAYYLTTYDPRKGPSGGGREGGGGYTVKSFGDYPANPVDVQVLRWVRGGVKLAWGVVPVRKGVFTHGGMDLEGAFHQAIVNICDAQILTGAGILISGFVSLKCGGGRPVSAYHWQIIVSLAWFASISHLAGVSAIRQHLKAHPRKRNARLLLMALTLVALLVALTPTAYFSWFFFAVPWSPAVCYFGTGVDPSSVPFWNGGAFKNRDSPSFQSMMFSIVLLVYGAVVRCSTTFRKLSFALRVRVRRPVSRGLQKPILWIMVRGGRWPRSGMSRYSKTQDLWFYVVQPLVMALFFTLRLMLDLFGSMLFELYWLIGALAWGSLKLWAARDSLRGDSRVAFGRYNSVLSRLNEEDQWSFGQTLAVLLLALPVWSLVETLFFEARKKETTQSNFSSHHLPNTMLPPPAATQQLQQHHHLQQETTETGNPTAELLMATHFASAPGLGPCILGVTTVACVLANMFMRGVPMDANAAMWPGVNDMATVSVLEFWIFEDGALAYLVLALPLSCFVVFFTGAVDSREAIHNIHQASCWKDDR
ncbi:hypothetical protein CP532_1849 [Ophiocordyceps camponoti-leonardi (nom. inval.)]|nr:hypothetical protein CP532_1849 [Ophiocordyceps camponoti-leonardi (nom. inval.)]